MGTAYLVIMLYAMDGSGIIQLQMTEFPSPMACVTAASTISNAPQDPRIRANMLPYCVDYTTGRRLEEDDYR